MVDSKAMQSGRYKAYPEYKDSGVEWLGEIPSHWRVRRVKEIANVISGYPFDSKKFDPSKGTPLIRIRDIRSLQTEVYFDGYVPKEALIKNGDVLIGMDGDFNVAKWQGGEAALNQRVACVRHDNIELQQFLYYVMPFNMQVVNDLTYYTTVKHLSVTDILKTKFSLPPNNELQNIIFFLDYETAKIDSLIEKQQRLIELLTEKRQAVISHAVTKGLNPDVPMKDSGVEWLGEVPEHWEVSKLKYYSGIQGGYAFSSQSFSEQGVPVLKIANVYQNRLALERQPTYVSEKMVDLLPEFVVQSNDILMSLTGTLGKRDYGFAVKVESEGKYLLNQRVAKLNPIDSKVNRDFLVNTLWSESYLNQLYSLPSGTKQANLSNSDVLNIWIAIPPTKVEQEEIANRLAQEKNIFDQLVLKAKQAIQLMQERRTALISAAITGKIDVRDWAKPE